MPRFSNAQRMAAIATQVDVASKLLREDDPSHTAISTILDNVWNICNDYLNGTDPRQHTEDRRHA